MYYTVVWQHAAHTRAHTRTRTHTHARAHTHTHTHKHTILWAEIAQTMKLRATVWTDRGSNSVGAHPVSYIIGTEFLPGVKRPRRGVNHPPHLVPRLKKE
jgi:hypothetical protein